MHLEVTEDAKQLLAKKGWDPQFGARPLRRAIQREVEDELAEEMLKGNFGSGDRILAEVESGQSGEAAVLEDPARRAARAPAVGGPARIVVAHGANARDPRPSGPLASRRETVRRVCGE